MNPAFDRPILLIADDDANFGYLVRAAAERTGEYAEVHLVSDGRAALERVHELNAQTADAAGLLVLSDLSMPRMDGLDLLRELKRNPETRDIPVGIMTSSNRPSDRDAALRGGCCAFFPKPERFGQISQIVESLLRVCGGRRTTAGAEAFAAVEVARH